MRNSASLFYTKEVRWFFQETPHNIQWWFDNDKSFVEKDRTLRTDVYLGMQPHDNISYKIREGRTEIKLRLGEAESIQFPNGHIGKVERWVKWSLQLKDRTATFDSLYVAHENSFIEVSKKRELVTFEIDPDKTIKKVRPKDLPGEGCQVEFTQLLLHKQEWTSFGFEAFGSQSGIEENFDLVTRKVLQEIMDPTLDKKDSFSYPYFLISV